jgi:hypothetical protein
MEQLMGKRRGGLWIKLYIIAFIVFAMATACTTTKYMDVKDREGNPLKIEIKTDMFSNKIKSATIQGEKLDARGPVTKGIIECSWCGEIGGIWYGWPRGCQPCPPTP